MPSRTALSVNSGMSCPGEMYGRNSDPGRLRAPCDLRSLRLGLRLRRIIRAGTARPHAAADAMIFCETPWEVAAPPSSSRSSCRRPRAPAGTVAGRVILVKDGKDLADASNSVVWIEGAHGAAAGRPSAAEMKSASKRFQPRVVAVSKNATVEFPNADPIYHNVFSVSGANRFDLGLYRSGASKPKTFEEPGLVRDLLQHPPADGRLRSGRRLGFRGDHRGRRHVPVRRRARRRAHPQGLERAGGRGGEPSDRRARPASRRRPFASTSPGSGPRPTRTSTARTTSRRRPTRKMSVTEAPGRGATSAEVRPKGLRLPPPEPPKFSLTLKIFLAMALLILVAVGGAVAVSAFRARAVADAKIAEDLKKAGPGWESFQQNRYDELHRALAVVVNNAGTISMMSTLVPETGRPDPATVFDTLKREQASSVRADFLIATTPEGAALARTDRPLPYAADLSAVPTIAGALQGAQTEGIWLSGGKLYHVVAAPGARGRRAPDGRHRRGLPDRRRSRAQPRAPAQHAGRVPRRRGQTLRAGEGVPRGLHHGSRHLARRAGDPEAARPRPGGPAPGADDRPARPRAHRRDVPRLPPAHPVVHGPARRRCGRAAEPREGARGLPPDPGDPRRRRARRARHRLRAVLLPRATHHGRRRTPRRARPSRSASAISTPRICPSNRRTRSASSRGPSGRCSRSCARRRPSSSTWRR